MQFPRCSARSRAFRVAPRLLIVVAVAVVLLGRFAGAAGAHSAMLTASARCPEQIAPNSYAVDYEATSWASGDAGAHPHIQVQYSINDGPFVAGADFAFPNQASPPSVSGSFTVTSAATITSLRVQAVGIGSWASGNTETGPWDQSSLDLPWDCQPSGKPDTSAAMDCAAGGAVVTLVNAAATGGEGVAFTVDAPAGGSPAFSTTTSPVAAGGSTTVTVPFAEGETRTITVTAPWMYPKTFTFTRNCEQPGASVSHGCAATGLDVTVTNTGDDSGVFSINGTSATVAPGDALTVNVAVAEGATVVVTVTLDWSPVAGSPFTLLRDCQHPASEVSAACAVSGLDVTVTNTGDDHGVFSINGTSATVAPGDALTVNVAVPEGTSVVVTVTLDGVPVAGSPFTFARDCEQPAVVAVDSCTDAGLDVTLSNQGESPAMLVVAKNGTPIDTVVVPAHGSVVRNYPLAEDEVAVFRVTGATFDSGGLSVTHDCAQPSAPILVRAPTGPPPPAELAFTGADTGPLGLLGGLLALAGCAALLAGRRPRRGLTPRDP